MPRSPRNSTMISTCVWDNDVTEVRGGDGDGDNDCDDADDEGHMLQQNWDSKPQIHHEMRSGCETSV